MTDLGRARPLNILYLDATRSLYGASKMLLLLVEQAPSLNVRPYAVLANDVEDDMRLCRELDRLKVPYLEHNLTVLRRQKYLNVRGLVHLSLSLVRSVRFLRGLIRKYRIDIVQSNTSTILSGAVAARLAGVPHVWHVHELFRPIEGRVLARLLHALSTRVVVPSEAVLANLGAAYPPVTAKLQVIKNGIDPLPYRTVSETQVEQLRAEWKIPPGTPVVGMIGRIGMWKGEVPFVEMAAKLTATGTDARFVIVGGVFDERRHHLERLEELIAQRGLKGRVIVAGLRADVPVAVNLFDVLVHLPLRAEPFGLVAVEAMAAGKPVVAVALGGLAEIVDNNSTGFLVQPDDLDATVQKVALLLQDRALASAMGKRGSERVDALFLSSHYASQFDRLYRQLETC
ncbi:MAG: glycosyltransferase family 4 protein [Chloroflexota bacterium]|nr:glycosyltransferase family 4 protein [Chloroflexota bacterium]MDQ5866912.1 glycosyltransferase family 4 protein [Chloroflexota bacterium]